MKVVFNSASFYLEGLGIQHVADTTLANDIVVGVAITFAIGFVVVVVSTMLTQASAVYEQAALTKALHFVGAPFSLHWKAAFKQTFYPMLALSLMSFAIGVLLSLIVFQTGYDSSALSTRALVILAVFFGAVVVVGLMTVAVNPLRRRLVNRQVRRND